MKAKQIINFSLFICFIFYTCNLSSQAEYKSAMYDTDVNFYDVCRMAEDYFSTVDRFKKGSGWTEFMRWKSENEGKYYPDGDRKHVDHYIASRAFQEFKKNAVTRSASPAWVDLGPYSADNISEGYNPGIGRIECFEVNRQNPDQLYMGSRSGGFWRTMDGGNTWKNTTDYLVATGVNTMDTDPLNFNDILINIRNANNGFTHGIYRSTDGGNTWNSTVLNSSNGFGGLGKNLSVHAIRFHPRVKNVIFIATSNGLYRSSDNLATFTVLIPGGIISDIEFHPTDPNYVYLIHTNTAVKSTLTISSDMGLTFKASGILPTFNGASNINGFLDVTPAKPNNVYFASGNGNSVYKSNDRGATFVKLGSMSSNSVGYFAVSDVDTLNMVSGYLNLEGSRDGGVTFAPINQWNTTAPDDKYTHADLRAANCIKGVFYIGTDGYFCRSFDFGNSWERLNNGTSVREFYRIGISQSDKQVAIGGSQDNGTSIINENGWLEWNGGDGMEAIVHPLNRDIMVGSWQYGSRQRTEDGGRSRLGTNNPQGGSDQADWIAPLLVDPSDHMKIYHFSDTMFVSDQFGEPNTWSVAGSPKLGILHHAAIAENNSNFVVVSRNAALMLSTDKGVTWKSISTGLPGFSVADICFDPKFDSTIVVCYERYEADIQKVFISHNLGKSWTNITFNIGNMPIRALAIDHTPARNIYVGGEIGVYTKPMKSNTWELYNTNLPNMTVRDFEIHYGSNTLKAATWGRGLWEVDIKDRESFPKIVKTIPSNKITSGINIPRNSLMSISAAIEYEKSVSEVYLLWSHKTKSLENKIPMALNQNLWKTNTHIPPANDNEAVYFKIVAIGSAQDTTETYTYMYRQGACVSKTETRSSTACDVFIYESDTLFKSGIITKSYKDIFSCDSIVRYNVTIDIKPNNTVTVSNTELISNEVNATSYQWLDCENQNAPIAGQTKRNLTIGKNGIYAVQVKRNSCIDTSYCTPLFIVGNEDSYSDVDVSMIPNPNQGDFIVNTSSKMKDALLEIYQIDGKKLFSEKLNGKRQRIKVHLMPGVYNAVFRNQQNEIRKKLYITQ